MQHYPKSERVGFQSAPGLCIRLQDVCRLLDAFLRRRNLALYPFLHRLKDSCRIPDDWIDKKRYPLFMARDVLRGLVQSLQSTGKP